MMRISFVIPTFNSGKFIGQCLESILAQGYKDAEIIVVDNGSKDNTVALITQYSPQATLIRNNYNAGACRGRNQGIDIATGDWVVALDCDCMLEEGFLSSLNRLLESVGKDVGMIQPKILRQDKKTIYSLGIFLSAFRRFYDIGNGRPDNGTFQNPKNIFGTCTAAAVLKKQMLKEIQDKSGYFDERFFFLVEDVDLSWRAQKKGWKTLFFPALVCYHYGNAHLTKDRTINTHSHLSGDCGALVSRGIHISILKIANIRPVGRRGKTHFHNLNQMAVAILGNRFRYAQAYYIAWGVSKVSDSNRISIGLRYIRADG